MKPLNQMTRDELHALDENDLSELVICHNITLPIGQRTIDNYFKCIEECWQDLQQDAAEARCEDR